MAPGAADAPTFEALDDDYRKLFKHLDGHFFNLLAGSRRYLLADLIVHLNSDVFYGSSSFITRKRVFDAIDEFLRRYLLDEEARAALSPDIRRDAVAVGPTTKYEIYKRLADTGWLVESRDRGRVVVDLNPNARMVIGQLIGIRDGAVKSLAGEILQVFALVDAAARDPDEQAENIRSAARSAASFLQYLRTINGALRQIEEHLLQKENVGQMLSYFFEEFVTQYLLEDYARLKRDRNPLKFRQRIVDRCHDVLSDRDLLERLAAKYVRDGRAADIPAGCAAIEAEVSGIHTAFDSIDDYVALIDASHMRLEERFHNVVMFMDRIRDDEEELTQRALAALAGLRLADDAEVPAATGLADKLAVIGPKSIFDRQATPRVYKPTPVPVEEPDPVLDAYLAARTAFFDRATVTPAQIGDYVDRHMAKAGAAALAAGDFRIEGVTDFFVYEQMAGQIEGGFGDLGERFEVVHFDREFSNAWVRHPDFIIKRKVAAHG